MSALDKAPPDVRLYLLHGPDQAGAMAYAQRLGAALARRGEVERIDLDPATLRSDPSRLADEAAAISLFGGMQWVRVLGAGEESAEAVETLLAAPVAGNPAVVIAPGVKASGRLVKAALAAGNALAFACYPPEGRQADALAMQLARDEGIRLSAPAARRLAAATDNDRALMAHEVTKLALYLDAASDRMVDADEEVLAAIGANLAESQLDTIVAAVIARDGATLAAAMRDAQGPDASPVTWLRALQRRLGALAEMRAEVDRGEGAEQVVKRHRVFWKEEAATIAALRRWNGAALVSTQAQVRAAERAAMAGGDAARTIADAALLAAVIRR